MPDAAPSPSSAPEDAPDSPDRAASDEDAPDASRPARRSRPTPGRRLLGSLSTLDTVLVAGGIVMLMVLLYEMEVPPQEDSFLNPPLVALAGAVLLWPLRRNQAVRAILLSGGVLMLIWAMDKVSGVLIPFVSVYLIGYLLNPFIERLKDAYRVPRWLSSLLTTGAVVGTVAVFILILAPNIADQVESLSRRLLETVDILREWLRSWTLLDGLEESGYFNKQDLISQVQAALQDQAQKLPEAVERLANSLGSLLGIVTLVAVVPVLLFYILKDYPLIRDALIGLFPTAGGRRDYLLDASSIVGNYLRGQLIISTIAATNVSVALFIFDVPFWLLIGLIAGILNFIPNLGAIVALIFGGFVAFVFGGWIKVFVVVVVLLGQALLEQSILTPNILSYQVGLHPVLVLFSLLVFGTFLGIFGLLIAVPLTAILVTGYRAYREELTLELDDYSNG